MSHFDSGVKNSGVSKTTRYQFTPDQDMIIRSDSGFVANQGINVHIEYRRARHYYSQGWVVCDSRGSVAKVSSVTSCPPNYASATIKVKVKAPVVEVAATVDNGSTKRSAQTKKDSLGKCSNKLKINGAVISKNSPKLLRTFGSGNFADYTNQWDANTTSSTSEWLNYTPNSWLVPYGDAKSGTLTGYTISSQSVLPARY